MVQQNDVAFMEKVFGAQPSSGPEPLNEARAEEDNSLVEMAEKELAKGKALDEVLGTVLAVGGTVAAAAALGKWLYKKFKKPEPKPVDIGSPFMSDKDAAKLEGKTVTGGYDYLDTRLMQIEDGDVSLISTPITNYKFSVILKEMQSLNAKIMGVRKLYLKLNQEMGIIELEHKSTSGKIEAMINKAHEWLAKKIGGEVGETSYAGSSEPVRKQLDLALTMRQVGVNVMRNLLPCGAERVSKAPELSGVSVTAEDERIKTTDKMWGNLIDNIGSAIPTKYGGDLIPVFIRPHKASAFIKDIGDSGATTFVFDGLYHLEFKKNPNRPAYVTVKLKMEDKVFFREGLGNTEHTTDVISYSFPNINEELPLAEI